MKKWRNGWLVASLLFLVATAAQAGTPCCGITVVDARTGLVTAKVLATGKVFQFRVADAAKLKGLHVGSKVWADFAAGTVSLDGASPCCGIATVNPTEPVGNRVRDKLTPAEPCCNVTALDAATGVVTAKWKSTGRVVKFQVADKAFASQLRVGKAIDISNSGANRLTVRISGAEPVGAAIIP